MDKVATTADQRMNRRIVLKAGAALAAAGSAVLRGGPAEAQPRSNGETALIALCRRFYDIAVQGAWRRH